MITGEHFAYDADTEDATKCHAPVTAIPHERIVVLHSFTVSDICKDVHWSKQTYAPWYVATTWAAAAELSSDMSAICDDDSELRKWIERRE